MCQVVALLLLKFRVRWGQKSKSRPDSNSGRRDKQECVAEKIFRDQEKLFMIDLYSLRIITTLVHFLNSRICERGF